MGNYSHGAIGLFIHDFNGREWVKSVIHPKFDPAFRHQGMDGSWPVKGLISGDFDGDGEPESGIALNRCEPAWEATLGKYGIYYMEPVWEYTGINELEARSREEPVQLFRNYPNPFNNSTTIKFEISKKVPVTIAVCNINGQVVDFLFNGILSPGTCTIEWEPREHNGHSIPGGVYFCLIESKGVKQVKKILLLK